MDSPAGGAGVLIAEFSGNALRCLPVQTRWLLQEGLPHPPRRLFLALTPFTRQGALLVRAQYWYLKYFSRC